ncbi:MAG: class I SAM-dependent methyltransferase [Prevotellaceae bacterium]|jgi:SAM-dependent methyltransferase|nr:class I SAM-dependent methyltransferase [Prevotellaceae bacterium]
MYDFHEDSERYFRMQKTNCNQYVIPFIEKTYALNPDARVLEIGCGTGGVLSAFLERGYRGAGVDIEPYSLNFARKKLADYIQSGQLIIVPKDIYLIDPETELNGKFDLIVLKDVVEHIPHQERLMEKIKDLLRPGGAVYFGFPPWQMPFGGHQQICRSKFLSRLPYFHLLPAPAYKAVLDLFGEMPGGLLDIKKTGISIERFEKIVKNAGYKIIDKDYYFINPIYKYKFNMKVRKQSKIIASIPYLRDFLTTGVFYLIIFKK